MKFNEVFIPKTGLNQKRLSDIIIFLLVQEWPLTVKGIQSRTKNKFSRNVSLQAVYKEINKLEKENIVLKSGSYFKLNLEWLKEIQSFGEKTLENYKLKETNLVELP
ncbi:MAG: hypothetical protein ABH986_04585 [archaeon]